MPSGIYIKTKEHGKKISEAKKGKIPKNVKLFTKNGEKTRFKKGNKLRLGKSWIPSKEWRKKQAELHKGEKSYLWKGGAMKNYSEMEKIRKSIEYKSLLKNRMEFDDYRCMDCGERGGKLEVNHILEFSKYSRLRMEFNNLETLCKSCHRVKTNAFMKKSDILVYN